MVSKQSSHQVFDILAKNSRKVLLSLLGLVLVVGAVVLVQGKQEGRGEAAKSALFMAQRSLETELKAVAATLPQPEKPDAKKAKKPGEAPPASPTETAATMKLDVDAKFPSTVQKLSQLDQQFNGTRAAQEARMLLGDLYYRHGHPAKATEWYQKAVQAASSGMDKALAYSAMGYALENSGKAAEAITAFEKAASTGEGSVKGDALLAIARCYETLKDSAKARSTYDQVLSQLPSTEYAKSAEALKSQLD